MDTSVLIAASVSANGASRLITEACPRLGWRMLTSPYAVAEVEKNLAKFSEESTRCWRNIKPTLVLVNDVTTFQWINIFTASKDRPILFTAANFADVLLTLDRRDFHRVLGTKFYGLAIRTPGEIVRELRDTGRLSIG